MHSLYEILTEYPHNPHYIDRYIKFINYCKSVDNANQYLEKHHICMKSMFPELSSFTEFPWNCIKLTARQHYIAHWILWKAYNNREATFAFHIMTHGDPTGNRYKIKSSRVYNNLIIESRRLNSGKNSPLFGTKRTKESLINQKLAVTGKTQSKEHIAKRVHNMLATKAKNKLQGISYSLSEETKAKISKASKGKSKVFTADHIKNLKCHVNNSTQVECPYCHKIGQLTNMKRWHFDNCKNNSDSKQICNIKKCSVCGHEQLASPNFYRYHESNCKSSYDHSD